VTVYNLLGREVAVLENRMREAGEYVVQWDGRDKAGRRVPPGIYFYRLRVGEVKFTRQLVLLR